VKAIKILGILGSLRKGSYNRFALVAAQKFLPKIMDVGGTALADRPSAPMVGQQHLDLASESSRALVHR
jgi:NAD(P)H-dependent FMN reductase